jgi:hypothetical protein
MLARGRDDTHKNVVVYALEAASSERALSLSSLTLLHMLFFYVIFVVRRVHCFFTEKRQRSAILFVDVVAYAVFF